MSHLPSRLHTLAKNVRDEKMELSHPEPDQAMEGHTSESTRSLSLELTLSLKEYPYSTTTFRVPRSASSPRHLTVNPHHCTGAEALPLNEPNFGWRANFGVWVRAATQVMTLALLSGLDTRHLLPERIISNPKIVLLSVIVGLVYILVVAAVAELWVFPIPFMLVVMGVPYAIIYTIVIWCLFESESIRRMHGYHQGALLRHVRYVQFNSVLLLVYPAFQALFTITTGTQFELPMLLMAQPVIKTLMKQLMARRASHHHYRRIVQRAVHGDVYPAP
jgi:hypothetical protein